MNATTSALARIAGVAIVLILAAALGLMAGNALNARDARPAGGPGPFPNVRGNVADDNVAVGAPAYADPYRQLIQQGAAVAADESFTQTWGNLDERRHAPSSDDASGAESLTAPTLR